MLTISYSTCKPLRKAFSENSSKKISKSTLIRMCVCLCMYVNLYIKSTMQPPPSYFSNVRSYNWNSSCWIRNCTPNAVERVLVHNTVAMAFGNGSTPIHRMEMRNDGHCNFHSTIQCPYFNDNNGIWTLIDCTFFRLMVECARHTKIYKHTNEHISIANVNISLFFALRLDRNQAVNESFTQ